MTAPSSKNSMTGAASDAGSESDLHAALHVALTACLPRSFSAVYELMHTGNLSFSEAALRLGFATQETVDDALARAQPKDGVGDIRLDRNGHPQNRLESTTGAPTRRNGHTGARSSYWHMMRITRAAKKFAPYALNCSC